jgi:cysteinyl-tRNA synthetase
VLRQSALALGLLQRPVSAWFTQGGTHGLDDAAIDALIAERQAARAAKDFATADRIRDELLSAGIELEDTPAGPRWRRAR